MWSCRLGLLRSRRLSRFLLLLLGSNPLHVRDEEEARIVAILEEGGLIAIVVMHLLAVKTVLDLGPLEQYAVVSSQVRHLRVEVGGLVTHAVMNDTQRNLLFETFIDHHGEVIRLGDLDSSTNLGSHLAFSLPEVTTSRTVSLWLPSRLFLRRVGRGGLETIVERLPRVSHLLLDHLGSLVTGVGLLFVALLRVGGVQWDLYDHILAEVGERVVRDQSWTRTWLC